MSETVIYSFESLIGDVGGSLGLLLGASILSIYDDLIEYFKMVLEKIGQKLG
jgi:hypothetical protein